MPDAAALLPWVLVFVFSIISVRVVRILALRRALLDMPNERSSHKQPVPRLGGAAFVPVIVLAGCVLAPKGALPPSVMLAVLAGGAILYTVSLVDDFLTVSAGVRFVVQFIAAGCALWAIAAKAAMSGVPSLDYMVDGSVLSSVVYILLVFWIVALVNLYNFMDGIDGIAGLQAVVGGFAWTYFGAIGSAPFVSLIGSCALAGALGFLTLNWPPAKIFMGDAGSTVFGYIFAVMPMLAVIESKGAMKLGPALFAAALVVWPFLADGVFTILRRLCAHENIFKAHRSHLYQRLVIAGQSHRRVTCVYGICSVIGSIIALQIICGAPYAVLHAIIAIVCGFAFIYQWVVRVEHSRSKAGDRQVD